MTNLNNYFNKEPTSYNMVDKVNLTVVKSGYQYSRVTMDRRQKFIGKNYQLQNNPRKEFMEHLFKKILIKIIISSKAKDQKKKYN